jgi:hypothetical protein
MIAGTEPVPLNELGSQKYDPRSAEEYAYPQPADKGHDRHLTRPA